DSGRGPRHPPPERERRSDRGCTKDGIQSAAGKEERCGVDDVQGPEVDEARDRACDFEPDVEQELHGELQTEARCWIAEGARIEIEMEAGTGAHHDPGARDRRAFLEHARKAPRKTVHAE